MNRASNPLLRPMGALMIALSVAGCASSPGGPSTDLVRQIEAAKTPADHLALAAHYEREAATARSVAGQHENMSKSYRASPYEKGGGSMRVHCQSLIRTYQTAATQYDAMAHEHRQLAQRQP